MLLRKKERPRWCRVLIVIGWIAIASNLLCPTEAFTTNPPRPRQVVRASSMVSNSQYAVTLASSRSSDAFANRFNPTSDEERRRNRRLAILPWRRRRRNAHQVEKEKSIEYQKRKQDFADRFGDVNSLRSTFGENKNKFWGDLDAQASRRLYKTLLPRALMELYKMGVKSEDLAPLAYKARLAAKMYARERSTVPARCAACAYEGVRHWQRYGKFETKGVSYDQIYAKYAQMLKEEQKEANEDLTDQDATAKICLKILESSCRTNARIDKFVLSGEEIHSIPWRLENPRDDLGSIVDQLEYDVREILEPKSSTTSTQSRAARRIATLRTVARIKRRLSRMGFLDDD